MIEGLAGLIVFDLYHKIHELGYWADSNLLLITWTGSTIYLAWLSVLMVAEHEPFLTEKNKIRRTIPLGMSVLFLTHYIPSLFIAVGSIFKP